MTTDLRVDPELGDEVEPTLGASRICFSDLGILPRDLVEEVESELYVREYTRVELLLYSSSDTELSLEAESSADCLRAVSLRLRRCGATARELLEWIAWPEVSRVAVEGGCVEVVVPADNPVRVRNFMEKTGIKPERVIAYRGVDSS